MVETPDKITLPGLASNGRVSRRIQEHLGLRTRRQLLKGAQELQVAHIPRQGGFADPPKHPHRDLQQRTEALRPIRMHLPTGLFLLWVLDKVMHRALERTIAARRIRSEPTARVDREVGRLLHRLASTVPRRLDDDTSLAADPGDDRGSVFVVMASP